jgi:hypothetical protein
MFLDKPEDIAYFNRIMRDSPHLEPYFAELAVWAWIYKRDEYLEIVKKHEEGGGGNIDEAFKKMEIEENN